MFRRYSRSQARFDQPDPYAGSYSLSDPQSLNRYAYVQNDPVNFTDPTGLEKKECDGSWATDPVTGEPYCVPSQDFGGVTVFGGGVEMHPLQQGRARLDTILMLMMLQSLPQNPTPRTPMSPGQVAGLATDIAELLKNPQCAEFMARLFMRLGEITGNAPYSINPMDVFNAVRAAPQGGLFTHAGSSDSGYTFGTIALGTATIALRHISNSPMRAWSNGGVGLHEITHVGTRAGYGYGHTEMAQAAYDVARAMGLNINNLGRRPANNTARNSQEWRRQDNAASTYFTNRLFDACKGS